MKKFFYKLKKDEKGIALLFTLGILALLLVMALAFATNSIVEQKVASATNTRSQTRLLARTAVNRALCGMTNAARSFLSFDDLKSHDSDSTHQAADWQDFLGNIETKLDGATIYDFSGTYYSSSEFGNSDALHWQYVKNSDSEIIGRYAYVIIPSNGALDPSAAVDSGANSIPYSETSSNQLRPGVEVNEIYIDGLNDVSATDLTSTQIDALSADNATPTSGGLLMESVGLILNQFLKRLIVRLHQLRTQLKNFAGIILFLKISLIRKHTGSIQTETVIKMMMSCIIALILLVRIGIL